MEDTIKAGQPGEMNAVRSSSDNGGVAAMSKLSGCGCKGNENEPVVFVYALGRVSLRFPSISVEKELAQATARLEQIGRTDRETLSEVLRKRENRYLLRKVCWTFSIQGLDTYILVPRDPLDLEFLIEAAMAASNSLSLVIGYRSVNAPHEMCNGLTLPIVIFDQMYFFEKEKLIKSIPCPEKTKPAEFESAAIEVFERIIQLTDNAGSTDEYRALNYLAVRYPALYATVAEAYGNNYSLSSVDVRPSSLAGIRKIVDVIIALTHRTTDITEKYFVRVDVTDEFPFLVSKMTHYYDR